MLLHLLPAAAPPRRPLMTPPNQRRTSRRRMPPLRRIRQPHASPQPDRQGEGGEGPRATGSAAPMPSLRRICKGREGRECAPPDPLPPCLPSARSTRGGRGGGAVVAPLPPPPAAPCALSPQSREREGGAACRRPSDDSPAGVGGEERGRWEEWRGRGR
uniref:Uncharacterized protein n=1 Tax=Oryza rufipogon TaxID=4529 RepID=A0A0E0R8R2_ORYRU